MALLRGVFIVFLVCAAACDALAAPRRGTRPRTGAQPGMAPTAASRTPSARGMASEIQQAHAIRDAHGFAWNFTAGPAADLQPAFMEQPQGWLGADIATSVLLPTQVSPTDKGGTNENITASYLWLFGDTLLGVMLPSGNRDIFAMPRNSVGILNVTVPAGNSSSGANPALASPLSHFTRQDSAQPMHVGFWTPPGGNASQWYWPTAALTYADTVFVFAYRMAPDPSDPTFDFQTVAVDVIAQLTPSAADPLSWPAPAIASIPNMNNSFTLGCNGAAMISEVDGFAYLLGAGDSNPQFAMLARLPLNDLVALSFDALAYYVGNGEWAPWSASIQVCVYPP